MPHIHETITIDANPDDVWQLAGDPGRIAEWLPVLEKSSLAGDRRNCTLADGGELVERILERNDVERYYEYEITDSQLPVRGYRSRLTVHGHDGHTHVEWAARFEAERPEDAHQVEEQLAGTYRGGLEALRGRLERRAA
jgi:hypothetical protein